MYNVQAVVYLNIEKKNNDKNTVIIICWSAVFLLSILLSISQFSQKAL